MTLENMCRNSTTVSFVDKSRTAVKLHYETGSVITVSRGMQKYTRMTRRFLGDV